jgi:hypothetical protein
VSSQIRDAGSHSEPGLGASLSYSQPFLRDDGRKTRWADIMMTLAIVDDQPAFCVGVRQICEEAGGVDLVGAYGTIQSFLEAASRAQTLTENPLPPIQPEVFAEACYRQALQASSARVSAAGHPPASADKRSQVADGVDNLERALAVADATCNRQVELAEAGRLDCVVRGAGHQRSRAPAVVNLRSTHLLDWFQATMRSSILDPFLEGLADGLPRSPTESGITGSMP